MHLTNNRLPKVDLNYMQTKNDKPGHGPRMAGSGFGKPNKCIGTLSSDCTEKKNRHFACCKLDCPCECHNEE